MRTGNRPLLALTGGMILLTLGCVGGLLHGQAPRAQPLLARDGPTLVVATTGGQS